MSDSAIPVQKFALHRPSLEEVSAVLERGLKENFKDVHVAVVDCPDLSEPPYFLAGSGLTGQARLADVGGVPNLIPTPKLEKIYNLEKVCELSELPGGMIMGAGAGPCHVEGVSCELIANLIANPSKGQGQNNTHIAKVNPKDGSYILKKPATSDFCLMGNFFICEGKPGKVLEVKASVRTGPLNYMTCLRKTLEDHYGTNPVALGGTFLIGKGKANIHVMPGFSDTPLQSDSDVNNWLKFYEMSAPLICVGELVSYDPDLDLRIEHFHCFSSHGDGGHYHYDTTPSEVEYRGYFNVAEYIFRIDRPEVTHQIGRD